jgi:glyoxylate/hydroxypyruvate reductase A
MTGGAVLLVTGPWPSGPWAEAIRRAAPARPLHVWPDVTDAAAIRYALAWKPAEGILNGFPNLEAIFSLGAGVDHIILQPGLPKVPIVRVVSADLTQRMTEWVTLQVLMHHRRQRIYDAQQAERRWRELPQPAAAAVRVGIMGLGVLGRDAAAVLKRLGFQVAGWSRRPAVMDGVAMFHGQEGLTSFLRRTDILVCLLPLTPETKGILSMPLFREMPHDGALGGPVVINGGRGGLQVEEDIVTAIRDGVLAGASIDVFATEPLDSGSALWTLPNVVITPHVAAASTPDAIAPEIIAEIEAYERGRPLRNIVDPKAYY